MFSFEEYCRLHHKAKRRCLQRATVLGFRRHLALMRMKKEPCQDSIMLKASTVLLAVIYDTPSVHLLKKDLSA